MDPCSDRSVHKNFKLAPRARRQVHADGAAPLAVVHMRCDDHATIFQWPNRCSKFGDDGIVGGLAFECRTRDLQTRCNYVSSLAVEFHYSRSAECTFATAEKRKRLR